MYECWKTFLLLCINVRYLWFNFIILNRAVQQFCTSRTLIKFVPNTFRTGLVINVNNVTLASVKNVRKRFQDIQNSCLCFSLQSTDIYFNFVYICKMKCNSISFYSYDLNGMSRGCRFFRRCVSSLLCVRMAI